LCGGAAGTFDRLGNSGRMCGSWGRGDAGSWLARGRVLLAWYGRGHGDVVAVPVGRVVLHHPVGGRLAQALGILVDDGTLVVVGLCIVDKALAVALDLGEVGVSAALELVFDGVERDRQLDVLVVLGQFVLCACC
jgi:hypothetical protein